MKSNDKKRMKTWRQSQAKAGKKRMDVFVTEEDLQTLKDIRLKTRESYGEIIGRLIAPSNRGSKQLTIEIPADEWERLEKEYPGDELKVHLETHLADKAEGLLWSETGDF